MDLHRLWGRRSRTSAPRHQITKKRTTATKVASIGLAVAVALGMVTAGSTIARADVIGTDSFLPLYRLQDGTLVGCVDHGRASPGESGWVPYRALVDDAPNLGYLWWKYGVNPTPTQISALSYLTSNTGEVPHQNASAPTQSMTPPVAAAVASMRDEANRLRGPYTVRSTITRAPTATDGSAAAQFTVLSATGNPVSGVSMTFARSGSATSVTAGSGTTNAAGQVSVGFQTPNSTAGGVRATAASLPATTVRLWVEPGASATQVNLNSNRQRVVGRAAAGTSATATQTAARPAPSNGQLRVRKLDSSTSAQVGGAVFQVRAGSANGPVVATLRPGAGYSPYVSLPAGTYVVIETSAPSTYVNDAPNKVINVASSGSTSVDMRDSPQGKVSVRKLDNQTGAVLAGARFEVRTTGGALLAAGTTATNGIWTSNYLGGGVTVGDRVVLVETVAPSTYLGSTASVAVTVTRTGTGTAQATFRNDQQGKVSVRKLDNQTGAVLGGAAVAVRTTGGVLLASGTTNASGAWTSGYLGGGVSVGDRVVITETSAPASYLRSTTSYTVTVTRTGTAGAQATIRDDQQGRVSTVKTDSVTGARLAGAVFEVRLPSGTLLATGTTNASGVWTSGYLGSGVAVGDTVRITEKTAPSGYTGSTGVKAVVVTRDGSGAARWTLSNIPLPVPGRVSVIKTDFNTGRGLGGAVFSVRKGTPTGAVVGTITSLATGPATSGLLTGGTEVGDVVYLVETTAPAGYVLSRVPARAVVTADGSGSGRVTVTNARVGARAQLAKIDSVTGLPLPGATFTAEVLKPGETVWQAITGGSVLGTTETAPGRYVTASEELFLGLITIDGIASRPTLNFGDRIRFTEVAAPAGYKLPPVGQRTVTGTVGTDGDLDLEMENVPYQPQLATSATNADANLLKTVTGGSTIVDTVTYTDTEPGRSYTISGELQLISGGLVTATGITAVSAPFTPTTDSGTVQVRFTIPQDLPATWEGQNLVVFETLNSAGVVLATHADATDLAQTIYVPAIGTSATSANPDLGKTVVAGVDIIDTITYRNLLVGQEYTASGELMAIVDGSPVATGIIASATFTATTANGSTEVTFPFTAADVARFEGQPLVAFETVSLNGIPVAVHADVTDTAQTVYVPRLRTSAANGNADAGKTVTPGGTVVDTLTYERLAIGQEYTATGRLMVVTDTGTTPTGLTGTATFTPDAVTGTTQVTIDVPAAAYPDLAGKTLVVFQDISIGAVVVVSHTDPADLSQRVYAPQISTSATSADAQFAKNAVAGTRIVDTITYCGLEPGRLYDAAGSFRSGPDAADTGLRASSSFTPAASCGSTDVTYEFTAADAARLAGQKIVAFESISTGGVLVAEHADMNDAAQAMFVPVLDTNATNGNADLGKTVLDGGVIQDTVTYSGLVAGQKYSALGELMAVGKAGLIETGITGRVNFTATASSGTVVVGLTIPSGTQAKYAGQRLVVSQTLVRDLGSGSDSDPVAVHRDAADLDQSVYVPTIGTTARNQDTGLGKNVVAGGKLTDLVRYRGLIVGQQYTLAGEFQLKNPDGTVTATGMKATTRFIAKAAAGSITLTFDVPADVSAWRGRTLVAFERLSIGDVEVAIHADVNDTAQTVFVPSVRTSAANADELLGKTVTDGGAIADTVTYDGLEPGRDYTVSGEVQAIVKGKAVATGIVGSSKFTAATSNGMVTVKFAVPAGTYAKYAGQKLVLFETVKLDGAVVAEHRDLADQAQTVFVPSMGTQVIQPGSAQGPRLTSEGLLLTDRIDYRNLTPGVEYIATGSLKFTDGSDVAFTAEPVRFTPTSANGSVFVPMTVSMTSKVVGMKVVVAFESVAQANRPDVPVAWHKDLKSKSQSMELNFGGGGTGGGSKGGGKKATPVVPHIETGLGASSQSANVPLLVGGISLILLAGAWLALTMIRRRRRDPA
ncbi:MAG: VaFE repeat-containing surface-anchored protein [Nakamurella sp.]